MTYYFLINLNQRTFSKKFPNNLLIATVADFHMASSADRWREGLNMNMKGKFIYVNSPTNRISLMAFKSVKWLPQVYFFLFFFFFLSMEQLDILRCQVWKSHLCPKGPISVQPL
jgi:hypothetical protein